MKFQYKTPLYNSIYVYMYNVQDISVLRDCFGRFVGIKVGLGTFG